MADTNEEFPTEMAPRHLGVAEVLRSAGNALRRTFPASLWVKGEVSDYRPAIQGHHYFNLVEKFPDGSQALLPCAVWKNAWPQVSQKLLNAGVALSSGQEMLFQGTVRLYDGAGKLTFHVSDVYPEFTLGQIESQRRAVLARLQRENLIGLNRRVEMSAVPLRVAVLSSRSAAGLRDFEKVLSQSGYDFSVMMCEVPVQGPQVERSVCRALDILAMKQQELKLDAVCVVRGGGSATDLGWWNSYAICASIAKMPIPVITGIGHERDRIAADEVCHTAAPTPTAAAELLCTLVRAAASDLREVGSKIAAVITQRLTGAADAVSAEAQLVKQMTLARLANERFLIGSLRETCQANSRRSLAPHADALRRHTEALAQDGERTLRQKKAIILGFSGAITDAAEGQVHEARGDLAETSDNMRGLAQKGLGTLAERQVRIMAQVDDLAKKRVGQSQKAVGHLADLVQAYDPVHILRRGFSITMNAQGKAVKCAGDLALGETITTWLAAGEVASTVTQTS